MRKLKAGGAASLGGLVLGLLAAGAAAAEAPARPPALGKESVYAYAELAQGRQTFDAFRSLAPGAELRYRLYPHPPRRDVALSWRDGRGGKGAVKLAADRSFALEPLAGLERRKAQLVANLPFSELSWRPVVSSGGLPANVRRLGDLRLECMVGAQGRLSLRDERKLACLPPPETACGEDVVACARRASVALGEAMLKGLTRLQDEKNPYDQGRAQYLFISDKPVFSVTLLEGGRQFTLPAIWLYGRAEPFTPFFQWPYPREYLYSVPLEVGEWSNDAQVVLEPMVGEDGK
ncbi:hypothetical protein VK98_18900 [Chromobacterium sp. LK11]|uniref:hypothetical protein n=1 Tax=Chromobacterium sp. LK11 TaxID=1628212 RepID=UPI000652D4D6|nr:hypothetical protein [Chromobacterium sp. LK11]KMN77190.1 hypothetical protein VK98_18900 [Chromobacterium sp. LK11]